jgi:predicted dehydrogenase
MATRTVNVAVVGAGMAGRSHAAGYDGLKGMYGSRAPTVRLVAVADANRRAAEALATDFGFQRVEPSWEAVAGAADIDAVSVCLPNHEHRTVVEALAAQGKAILCEKPLGRTAAEAMAMEAAARRAGIVAHLAFMHRYSPAVAYVRELVRTGRIGEPRQLISYYFSDYARDPLVPFSWRYDHHLSGGGSLVDLGSHNLDVGRLFCGEVSSVRGAALRTRVRERALPRELTTGHQRAALSQERRLVTTDDEATFIADFDTGCVGTFVFSRVATGLGNATGFLLIGSEGSARFDWSRLGEVWYADGRTDGLASGFTRVVMGPQHPYLAEGLVMPVPGSGFGLREVFTFQAFDFVTAVAEGISSRVAATFADGVANALVMDAVQRSAAQGGGLVTIAEERERAASARGAETDGER